MASKRQPTHRASLEGDDETSTLRELLDELSKQSMHPTAKLSPTGFTVSEPPMRCRPAWSLALTSHPPTFNIPCLSFHPPPGIGVILTSSHHKAETYPDTVAAFHASPFSKQALLVNLLGVVDIYGKPDFESKHPPVHHLEIDLLRSADPDPRQETPSDRAKRLLDGIICGSTSAKTINISFPMQDLAPLTLFRQLTYLKIEGMMQTYQSQIWQCVWLNPHLHSLTLSMSVDGERLSSEEIRVARLFADFHPDMRQACHGHSRANVPEKMSVVKLCLTNFIVGAKPFMWFDGRKLTEIRLVRCKDAGFRLLGEDWRTTTVITVGQEEKQEMTTTNLMSPRNEGVEEFNQEDEHFSLAVNDLGTSSNT